MSLPPPTYVDDKRSFNALLDRLDDVDELAVDTEADSFFKHRERVCLIQITADGEDFIVDPLVGLDIEPLGEVFADPRRVKIFHDSEFDVLLLKRHHGFEFAELFDTRVALAAMGYESLGLAAALLDQFGVKLDKTQQLSDWGRRPLTDKQIGYARLDTHYLIELRERLEVMLDEVGRRHVMEAECDRLERLEPVDRPFEPDEYVRLKGARTLDRSQQAVLRALFIARERMAQERNVPPFKVLAHGGLVDLARACPKDAEGISRAAKINSSAANRLAKPLLAAIREGLDAGPIDSMPQLPPKDGTLGFDEFDHELHDRLKTLRKKLAERDRMDLSLVFNRKTLLDLVRSGARDREALARVEDLAAWQLEDYGADLIRVLEKFDRDRASGALDAKPRKRRPERRR
ncbi:ribonuclease D [Engelhardtia mirabilis]|uniref:Ribonuclease D n=1 Tax=Engelhardtia mirabilis TaxID=2528011 RepID=A0A518BHU9_9BACT|nr:Ribonuclease D [Planctomycetes bacterium Pla133]QDV00839.1 Ribonuclease D [Planctomycetes bacterium Pla86]